MHPAALMAIGKGCMEVFLSGERKTLVRITEVFLRDDVGIIKAGSSIHNGYLSIETAKSCTTLEEESCTTTNEESSTDHNITVYLEHVDADVLEKESVCVEELESAQQMQAFGLPLSFGSSKSRNITTSRSKRNGSKPKSACQKNERKKHIPQFTAFSQMENPSLSTSLHDNINISSCLYAMEGQVDAFNHDCKEQSWDDFHIDESKNISALDIKNETGMKPVLNEVSDAKRETLLNLEVLPDTVCVESNVEVSSFLSLHSESHLEESLEDTCSQTQFQHDGVLLKKHYLDRCSVNSSTAWSHMHLKSDTETLQSSISAEPSLHSLEDQHVIIFFCECEYWMGCLDPLNKQQFYYNFLSMESTWYPPLGRKYCAFARSNLCKKETHNIGAEKDAGGEHSCDSDSVVTDSLTENGDSHNAELPDAVLSVKISGKMASEFDFTSNYTTNGSGNSNVQFSLCPSYVKDDKKDEENECRDLDEQKEKQHGDTFDSYYGHDRPITLNTKGHTFSFPETCTSSIFGVHISHENVAINKKRRVRKSENGQQLTQYHSDTLFKYWLQRYSLFSKFDKGIKMDEESWFSVTPEQIAKHHAIRCSPGIIVDCFAGVGGNAIQFALRNNNVIAIDVDPIKIDYAKHNADIYGVSAKIDFIEGDFFKIASSLKGDVAFLAPPWGGPSYAKRPIYDLRSLRPHDGFYLFKIASLIAPKVVMFLPRNVNINQLLELRRSLDPPWNLEVEKNYLNGKLKTITAYFDCPTK